MSALSPFLRREIRALAARSPSPAAASLESLLAVQAEQGWVDDQTLAETAALLGLPEAELEGVATFYSRIFRRPVGRHVLSVCDSVSCHLLGGEQLLAWLEQRLGIRAGQTTSDGSITLLPTCCLGCCEQAPVVLADERACGGLNEARLEQLLAELASRLDRLPARE